MSSNDNANNEPGPSPAGNTDPSPAAVTLAEARELEQAALHAPDPEVRAQALALLQTEPYARLLRAITTATQAGRSFMVAEIRRLEAEKVVPPEVAQVIVNRYQPQAAAGKPVLPPEPKEGRPQPSLAQILLSDTTLRVALFLGAFFVVVAAFILAALVAAARVPVLLALTAAFFIAARYLKKRILLASFILFIAAATLIPIDARAIDSPGGSLAEPFAYFWPLVWLLCAATLAAGTGWYHSRLLLAAAFLVGGYTAALTAWTAVPAAHLVLLVMGLWGLAALPLSQRLTRPGQAKSMRPVLFWLAQAWQAATLAASVVTLLGQAVDASSAFPSGASWARVGLLWLAGAGHFLLSDRYSRQHGRRLWWAVPAVIALLPVPVFFASIWLDSSRADAYFLILWIWGILQAAAGAWIEQRLPQEKTYALALRAPLPLLALIVVSGEAINEHAGHAVAYLSASGLAFGLLALRPPRAVWSIFSLGSLYLAYLWQSSRWAESSSLWLFQPETYFLLAPLLLLAINLVLRKLRRAPAWQMGSLLVGILAAVIHSFVVLIGLEEDADWVSTSLLVWSLYWLGFAIMDQRPWLHYLSAAYLLLGAWLEVTDWLGADWSALLLGVLALAEYLLGSWLASRPGAVSRHGAVWRRAGLVCGALVTGIALVTASPSATVAPALAASAFALEAFRLRNIWLGYPANALYFCAYLIGLWNLDVVEPQFYSIGAALLGILMHYLVMRSAEGARSRLAAFITGVLAQLVLLSTTYIQMQIEQDFTFFFILFFQALALLIYGLTVRSKSFVLLPVVFLVLSALTVAFTILSGLSTALIIGITGLAMLLIGVLGLGFRARIAAVTEQFNLRLNNW